ncbi:RNA polymerase subunit sigma-70 [Sphingobium sp. SCG-1]|nr:RNA polymerase subunit sigma-70 [Sphingobium sp. SCG-1]
MIQSHDDGLSKVYHIHRPALLRLLAARTGTQGDAEDLLQELWIKVQCNPPVVVEHARAYLFRMAHNLATDRLRTRQRRMTRERRWSDEATDFATSIDEQTDRAKSAEQILLDREEVAILASAIANLPEGSRRVFHMHKIEGSSHAEVASRLGITRSGVEKHIAAAMKNLKRALLD